MQKTKCELYSFFSEKICFFLTKKIHNLILVIFCIFISHLASTQQKINWIDFEDLPTLQELNSKPMFIYIYADWCVYCKKMEQASFKDKENIKLLNENFYALKFNLETEREIVFNEKKYKNHELKTHRQPKHDLAKYLTQKEDKIPLPAIVVLDQDFNRIKILHTYLSPKQLKALLISTL